MRPGAGAGSRPQLRPSQPARANDAPSLLTMYGMSGAACGARPATAGYLRASAAGGCGPHGSKSRMTHRHSLQNHRSALSAPSIPAIAIHACYGQPQQCDGSLGGCRHPVVVLGFVLLCRRQQQRGQPSHLRNRGPSAAQCESFGRLLRALRPSICRQHSKRRTLPPKKN